MNLQQRFKIPCLFNWMHDWTEFEFRPCENFRHCRLCNKEDVVKGWHRFDNWSDTYYVRVHHCISVISHHDFVVTESRQNRKCKDCKVMDERTLH